MLSTGIMTLPPPLQARAHALFLDFDGTLVDFCDDPAAVHIDPPALSRLTALQGELSGALGIVSGRQIADLDRFLAPLAFAAAGVHGLERRMAPGGVTRRLAEASDLDDLRLAIRGRLAAFPCLHLEDKGTALVLHYRTAPELGAAAQQIMQDVTAGRADLSMMVGDGVVEVHPAGMDKGKAVADLMREAAFAGRIPVYAGDDVTDEFALAFVRQAGGISIKIGPAPTVAEFRLDDIAALHRWLGVAAV
jgi:trehalose 6-phosphate phosphatase